MILSVYLCISLWSNLPIAVYLSFVFSVYLCVSLSLFPTPLSYICSVQQTHLYIYKGELSRIFGHPLIGHKNIARLYVSMTLKPKKCTNKIEAPFKLQLHFYLTISTYIWFGLVVPAQNTLDHPHKYVSAPIWTVHICTYVHTYLWLTHNHTHMYTPSCTYIHELTPIHVLTHMHMHIAQSVYYHTSVNRITLRIFFSCKHSYQEMYQCVCLYLSCASFIYIMVFLKNKG